VFEAERPTPETLCVICEAAERDPAVPRPYVPMFELDDQPTAPQRILPTESQRSSRYPGCAR
jgi:hypothetical protein